MKVNVTDMGQILIWVKYSVKTTLSQEGAQPPKFKVTDDRVQGPISPPLSGRNGCCDHLLDSKRNLQEQHPPLVYYCARKDTQTSTKNIFQKCRGM